MARFGLLNLIVKPVGQNFDKEIKLLNNWSNNQKIILINMLDINTKTKSEQEFWSLLVYTLTGHKLWEMSKNDQDNILQHVQDLLLNYLTEFVAQKYDQTKSQQLADYFQQSPNLFGFKNSDLSALSQEAWSNFIENLKQILVQKSQPLLER